MPVPNVRSHLTSSGFGVELTDIDLAKLNDHNRNAVLTGFYKGGGLILIRNQQHITPEQLRDFVALFGSVELNEKYDPAFLMPGFPEILRIGNIKENGKYAALFIKSESELLWHTDDSFRDPQPIGSCLFCIHAPPVGAETWFAGMCAAYEALPEDIRQQIEPLTAVHSYNHLNELLRQKNPHRPPLSAELRQNHPPITRPLIAQHPVTRRQALYIPLCHIESVNGMSEEEARPLLADLLDHATQPAFTYTHIWQPGDLVVWDNRCTMHASSPFEDSKYERLMYRLTVNGVQIVGSGT